MNWKEGPLPPDTWWWGGVVTKDIAETGGFYFADFHGDHVTLVPGGQRVEAGDVVLYNNSLELPPSYKGTRHTPMNSLVFPPVSGEAQIRVTRLIDGDTFEFQFLLDDNKARVYGIDAPEMKGATKQQGLLAMDRLKMLMPLHSVLKVQIHGRDSFGRYLLDVFDSDGSSVGQKMIDSGDAVPYKR